MKRGFLLALLLTLAAPTLCGWTSLTAQGCVEESADRGECDTLNVICLDCDKQEGESGPWLVRFPLLVTHDQTEPDDSIGGFTVPLTFTHTNPAAFCSVSAYWNGTEMGWWFPNFVRSVFRHMFETDYPDTSGEIYRNRMALMEGDFSNRGWDFVQLTLDDTSNFWLTLVPINSANQGWLESERVLLATMSLMIEDTMHVCIDSTFWPPATSLSFSRQDATGYVPRHNLPFCFPVGIPNIQVLSPNGGEVWIAGISQDITWISQSFDGPEVTIEYSTNSGNDWDTVVNITANTGSYSWMIPDTPSDSCRVKVSDAVDGAPYDESDADFAIVKPDFTIECEPDTQMVDAGQSVDFSVILTSVYEFSSPCTLTVSGLPSLTDASFNPNPTTPTDTTVLTISTQGLTPAGTYTLVVTATEVGEQQTQHSTSAVLVVNAGGFYLEEAEVSSELMEGGTSGGEHCPKCVINWCSTTYPTYGDYDWDGMNDDYEMELARQFKPTLYYDDAISEISYCMPHHYNEPPYSHDSGPNHGMPDDIVSDGTVYVHVRPYDEVEPGVAFYIEVAYWFYYSYNQAECHGGYWAEHGHDWEHVALCLSVPPDSSSLQVVSIFFGQHEGWQFRGPDQVQWTGTPGLSSVKVYVVDGSHASYPSTGRKCTLWAAECLCWENANGGQMVEIEDSKIINLYELGDYRSPNWLDYTSRWPGYHDIVGKLPYGPAQGNDPPNDGHAGWWNYGHFVSPGLCVETWRDDVYTPENFQVSTFRDGLPITNALYLTWDGPSGWDGFNLRRCLVPIQPNSDDPTCECIAQLGPDTYSYFDSCLDGGTAYYYELKTFNDNPSPSYRGCSWPALSEPGIPNGDLCTPDLSPAAPRVTSCDGCTLRWEDNSWNEDGFVIDLHQEICDSVGPNEEAFPVHNCCTGNKRAYFVTAFNEYGEKRSFSGSYCNDPPDCEPMLGCEGDSVVVPVPALNQCGGIILIVLIIGTAILLMNRRKESGGTM